MAINSTRRSQLVIPFGVGSMIDFKDETWMLAGLNFWPSEVNPRHRDEIIDATQIIDKRLQDRLSLLLRRTNSPIKYFLQPTIHTADRNPARYKMPFVRFPRWHFCENCKKMRKESLRTRKLGKCSCGGTLTPIRFLIACEAGHIDDFPWMDWVHRTKEIKETCTLKFNTTSRPGLDGIMITCDCGAKRSMTGAMGDPEALRLALPNGCTGQKPWLLGEEEPDNCLETPVTVQRGASNAYFSNSVSSILVPPYSSRIRQLIDSPVISKGILETFSDAKTSEVDGRSIYDLEKLRAGIKQMRRFTPKLSGIDENILLETCEYKVREEANEINSAPTSEIEYRRREFQAYLGNRPDEEDRADFDILKQDLTAYSDWVRKYFSSIVLVSSLRETRVLTNFSRIKPASGSNEQVAIYKKDEIPDWLPALEVRGEGIFLQFNYEQIKKWTSTLDPLLAERTKRREAWLANVIGQSLPNFTRSEHVSAELIMIHTFSHIFMRQLIFNCGYDSSALRERLYVTDQDSDNMFGVLIYTASGDSEGTLGGLVSQGRAGTFEDTVLQAIKSTICANDPICIETLEQGIQGLNGAACHSCCLLPETSCEHSNTLLDRVFLTHDAESSETGFFADLLQNF